MSIEIKSGRESDTKLLNREPSGSNLPNLELGRMLHADAYQSTTAQQIMRGVGNVGEDLVAGIGKEISNPSKFALDVGKGIIGGVAAEAALACLPPVLIVAGAAAAAFGAHRMMSHGSEWLADLSIDFDRSHHSEAEVAKARMGLQKLGTGITSTLVLGVSAGVTKAFSKEIVKDTAVPIFDKVANSAHEVFGRLELSSLKTIAQTGAARVQQLPEALRIPIVRTHRIASSVAAIGGQIAYNQPSEQLLLRKQTVPVGDTVNLGKSA